MPASDARPQSDPANALPADTIGGAIFHSNDVYGEMSRRRSQDGFVGDRFDSQGAPLHGPMLSLDAGNALGPSPLSAWDQGTTMIDLMRLSFSRDQPVRR